MRSTNLVFRVVLLLMPLLFGTGVFADEVDDLIPDVTDRVARISFIQGEVQIRRAESEDWERAVLNLPIVEGDEIVTDGSGRFEIQFNSYTHLRAAENSYISVVGLKDEGIAISIPQGSLSVRLTEFDPNKTYFEIDAPKTTVSLQQTGSYRVDAGGEASEMVRVAVTNGGEARIYSQNSGFTLRNGRSAKVFIEGSLAGEWDTADASAFADEFDQWSLDRDIAIAERLKDSHYDQYYDRDIYGAEDLNDHGEWIHTRSYGYVWRPYQNSIRQYADWSPYRYGHWRWIPAFGWTWVNDEPWGWATYHHGRWVWDSGNWYWSPYAAYRGSRSWWYPALVVISVWGNSVCWYPLPYHYGYYNYNYHHYRGRRGRRGNHHQNPPVAANPIPSPTPSRDRLPSQPTGIIARKPNVSLPPGGVVAVPVSDFGRKKNGYQTASPVLAKKALASIPDIQQSPPLLPTYGDLGGKIGQEIKVAAPVTQKATAQVRTGATVRDANTPLDPVLRKARIFGDRKPLEINTGRGEIKPTRTQSEPIRDTGAVDRPERKPAVRSEEPIRSAPVYSPPVRQVPRDVEPVKPREERKPEPVRQPRYDPPTPRAEPSKPRYDPPVRQAPEPVRPAPQPRKDPPKSDPPQKKEPSKSAPPPETKKKTGR